jgi:hypothetical protein
MRQNKFEGLLLSYHRLATLEKNKLMIKLIMADKYDTSYIILSNKGKGSIYTASTI